MERWRKQKQEKEREREREGHEREMRETLIRERDGEQKKRSE